MKQILKKVGNLATTEWREIWPAKLLMSLFKENKTKLNAISVKGKQMEPHWGTTVSGDQDIITPKCMSWN